MSKKLFIAAILAIIASYMGLRQPDGTLGHGQAESQPQGTTSTAPASRHAERTSHSGGGAESTAERTSSTSSVPHVNADSAEGSAATIDRLTAESRVAGYLQQHQRLPDYYIRKSAARKQGWDPAKGNLCQVLPGRAIGGDRFSNREGGLPEQKGRSWYEADVNYQCGRRGADRLLYSSDGLIFVTRDHYRHFEQVK